ncbi:hypothetical protein DM01DRAFT_1406948 [Hesseltinella vesiculosa]|uniref:Pentacotripeptide-repeat region of PRORP domain-containing protein n=1 Tax=Hesseltinella vesiculosa TaxID=101127 RepID=A0A1X2GK98_9FUNG|nr:hypothetical protein DM01DRAFT_1406948 [Hesseltinella vesiculosa]
MPTTLGLAGRTNKSRPCCPSSRTLWFTYFRHLLAPSPASRPFSTTSIQSRHALPSPSHQPPQRLHDRRRNLWRPMSSASASSSESCDKSNLPGAAGKSQKTLLHPRWFKTTSDFQRQLDLLREQRHQLDDHFVFKSLRSLLYNVANKDHRCAWKVYRAMVDLHVTSQLGANHYGRLLNILRHHPNGSKLLMTLHDDMQRAQAAGQLTISAQHYEQLFYGLARQGNVADLYRLMVQLQQHQPQLLQPVHYTSLATAAKRLADLPSSIQVAQLLVKAMHTGVSLEPRACVIMVSALAADMEATVDFLSSMKQANLFSETPTTSFTSDHPAASPSDDTRPNTTTSMPSATSPSSRSSLRTAKDHDRFNVHMYTSLISGLAKNGDAFNAKRLWDEMTKLGLRPTKMTHAAMVDAFGRAGELGEALEWIQQYTYQHHGRLDKYMATSLLANALHHRQLAFAKSTLAFWEKEFKSQLLEDMDAQYYSVAMWVKVMDDMQQAQVFFEDMYRNNPQFVDSVMVNHLVKGYGNQLQNDRVLSSYAMHKKLKLAPDDRKYYKLHDPDHYLVDALFKCRDVPSALSAFVSMRQRAVPDDVTLAMVVRGLLMNDEKEIAWKLFKLLKADGLEPNLHAYTSILRACTPLHGYTKADNHQPGMEDTDSHVASSTVVPDLVQSALYQGVPWHDRHNRSLPRTTTSSPSAPPLTPPLSDGKLGPTQAYILFRKVTQFHQPNVYTYTALISCFAKDNIARAMDVFTFMCSDGVRPVLPTYVALLQGCAIFRSGRMAMLVFNHLQQQPDLEPDDNVWHYLLKALVRSRMDKKEIDRVGTMIRATKANTSSSTTSS